MKEMYGTFFGELIL